MKRRRRDFSPRERQLIDRFIEEICQALHLPPNDEDLHQCGWEAFLSVYLKMPELFSSNSAEAWRRAYQAIWGALEKERKRIQRSIYQSFSLEQPISKEVPVPRAQLLQTPHGDFQNSVCFYDYLDRMGQDVSRMAYSLIRGCSVEEISGYYRWSKPYTDDTYRRLQVEMQEYLRI